MRGLLSIVNDLYNTYEEEPSKPTLTIPSLPVVFFEERPALRTLARPIGRQIARRPCPYAKRATGKPADFSIALDVASFQPEEISVRVKDRDIIVEARHEERQDEHGYVARQFTRRYKLPDEYDPDTVSTYLHADGKMTIKALKPKPAEAHERIIPVQRVAADNAREEDDTMTLEKEKERDSIGEMEQEEKQ
jgi:HSP20 family molecular chaperone IbpA